MPARQTGHAMWLRRKPRAALRQLGFAMITSLLLMSLPRQAAAEQTPLLLEVHVNGFSIKAVGEFVLRDGSLLALASELRQLGFLVPASLASGTDSLVNLADLPGVSWQLDASTQVVSIAAGNELLQPVLLDSGGMPQSSAAVESGTGATLNYEVVGSHVGGTKVFSGLLDLRAFSPWGVASSGLLAKSGSPLDNPATQPVIRLDSTYTFSDPATLRRYRLGDFISGALPWTRPVRLGGLQLSSDFAMRPDLVTFPQPTATGSAAVPSTLDVMVNGVRQFSRELGAGPFEIPQLPVVTGAGTISLALNNALGRQEIVTLPFYASSALLAPGLQTFSLQAGALRRNWSVLSNDYGATAASASYRRGLSPAVTVEGTAEGTAGTFMTGGGVVVNAHDLAVLNVSAAGSAGGGHSGSSLSLGVQRIAQPLSLAFGATVASPGFRDVAAVSGDAVPTRQITASAGLSLGRFGALGLAYAGIDRAVAAAAIDPLSLAADQQQATRARVLTASYSVQLGGLAFFATGFRDFANEGSSGMLVGVTMPLGSRSSVSASVISSSSETSQQLQAQQSPVTIGDWGYQALVANGAARHEFVQTQYKAPWALLTAGVDRLDGQSTQELRAQGALSLVDGGLFASNAITDSFAIVDTDGLGAIRVLQENRDVGRTDRHGRLLVPDLRAFDVNHLAIEPTDVPLDTTIAFTTRDVRPQDRSGVVVRFPMKVSHAALLKLVDGAGIAVPPGSTATLRSTGAIVPIGYDGAAYVEDLAPHNEVTVELADGRRCLVTFDYRPLPGEFPRIGPLTCRPPP